MSSVKTFSEAERVELGLSLIRKLARPEDSELRILIFTATYFVVSYFIPIQFKFVIITVNSIQLDGVTLTIRRLESHLRSHGVWR